MSITPIMQNSAFAMQREEPPEKKDTFHRTGTYRSEDDHSNENDPAQSTPPQKKDDFVLKILENLYFQIFITFLTVITLFLYDIKTIAFTKEQDFAIGIVNCLFFVLFMGEIAMNLRTEGYSCSFFFYLDLISTITILFDVDFIIEAMFDPSSNAQVSSFVAKSKASRVAARAVRVIKIFRLARVAKLYKSAQRTKQLSDKNKLTILEKESKRFKEKVMEQRDRSGYIQDQQITNTFSSITKKVVNTISNIQRYEIQNDTIKQEAAPYKMKESALFDRPNDHHGPILAQTAVVDDFKSKESQISKILTEDTIKKIVIIILFIMVSAPLLDINNYQNVPTQWDYSTIFIANALANPNITLNTITKFISQQLGEFSFTDAKSSFICIDSPFAIIQSCSSIDFTSFRSSDLGLFQQSLNMSAILLARPTLQLGNHSSINSISIFVSYSTYNSIDSGFAIATTTFVCITIIYLLGSFSNNINELIIVPIERMLSLVRNNEPEEQHEDDGKEEEYETKLVQEAIVKIKALMETIYGPLGNELVHNKMLNNKTITDNLHSGLQRSFCVAALCRINHVPRITQVLGEDVFYLLNEIAIIVHNAAYRYGGYCTKIQDDGFLIIFKVPHETMREYSIEEDIDPLQLAKNIPKQAQLFFGNFCDFSVYSALKALTRIVKEPKLFKYRNDQRLLMSFGGLFNVQMNFALTMGWCYEAVIGSSHKIDPLFIGEQLNHLQRVMRVAKKYPNIILVTDSLYCNLTKELKNHIRPLQVIKFDENQTQKTVYFVDYDISNVTASASKAEKSQKQARDLKTKKEMNMLYLSGLLPPQKSYNAKTFIASKKELRQILKKTSTDQIKRKKYLPAFEKYIKGEWEQSQQLLENENLRHDLPAQRITNFMQAHAFRAPFGWKGYRDYPSLFQH